MRRPSTKDVLREVVVASAFLASAGHIYSVAVAMGNHPWIAGVHAVGVDGLVYIGIGAFRDGAKVRGGAAVAYGGGVSLAFNYAAYNGGTLPAWVIAASMPIVLVLAVLVSMSGVAPRVPEPRVKRVPAPRTHVPAAVSHVPPARTLIEKPVPVKTRTEWDRDKALRLLDEGRPRKEIADLCGVSRKTIDRLAGTGVGG